MFKRSLPYIIFILLLTFGFGLYPDSIRRKEAILRANQLNLDGNPSAALHIYTDLLREDPTMEYLFSKAGSTAYLSEEIELARFYLEKSDSVNLLSDSGKITLGDAYLHLGDKDRAELIWRKLQDNPAIIEQVSTRLIDIDIKSNRWDQAKRDQESWLMVDPRNEIVLENLGWITLVLNPQDALQIFEDLEKSNKGYYQKIIKQISTYPDFEDNLEELPVWWIMTGDLLEIYGKIEFSIKSYENAVEIDPEYAIGWAKLGLMKQKSNLDGKPEIEKALNNGAQDPFVNFLIADFWKKEGKPELALIHLHKVIELDNENTSALIAAGWLLSEIGSVDDGMGYIKQAAINLNTSEGWTNLIHYCLTYGTYLREEAIPAAREAVRISPDSAEVLDLAGQVFFSQDDLVTAERYFIKAVSLKYDLYAAHLHLAYLYIEQGHFDLAREHLKTVLEKEVSPDIREKAIQAFAQLPVE